MYSPTTRVLTVLEMLQSQERVTGVEIAERLEVHIRSVRRYIVKLEELGIPIEAERGRHGAYRLLPGYKLPPLMFTQNEALATLLGLLVVRQSGLMPTAPGTEGAIAKLTRVLPLSLRSEMRAVEETLVLDFPRGRADTGSKIIIELSFAARHRQCISIRYRSAEGKETERLFDPYGLVYHCGFWYAVGHCHLRSDLRLFRLDRVQKIAASNDSFVRPTGFDVLEYTLNALGSVPRKWRVEVLLYTTIEQARECIMPDVAVLESENEGVLLRCHTDDLSWMAHRLAGIGCRLEVRCPHELKTELRSHALSLLGVEETESGYTSGIPEGYPATY